MIAWQEEALEEISSYFKSKIEVLALLLFGSLSTQDTQPDYWSDIDILLVIADDKLEKFFPTVDWLGHFGTLYTYEQSQGKFKSTTRACFDDFRRIDIAFTTEKKLLNSKEETRNIIHPNTTILFSRSDVVNKAIQQNIEKEIFLPASDESFHEMVQAFRFKSMLATYKVVRNDLLIALHLSLDLVRDCSVLGMILRDKAEGSNIHKDGGVGNLTVEELQVTQKAFTAMGILDSIEQSNIIFERLAKEWSSKYQENRQPLLNWIEKARKEISHEE